MLQETHRTTDGHQEVPIHEFQHPETGSTISAVGMMHEALPGFFASVRDYVQPREDSGSIVHYEHSVLPGPEDLSQYPGWVQKLAPRLSALKDKLYSTTQDGYVYQYNCPQLTFKDNWELHDMDAAQITQAFGHTKAMFVVGTMKRILDAEAGRQKTNGLSHNVQIAVLLKVMNEVILKRRNEVALTAMETAINENPDQDITLLWGCAHLPGIAAGILARGYQHQDTSWLRARVDQV